jgi:hypothetical protein
MGNDIIMAELIKIVTETNAKVSVLSEKVDNHVENTEKSLDNIEKKLDTTTEEQQKQADKLAELERKLDEKINKDKEKIDVSNILKWSVKNYRISLPALALIFALFGWKMDIPVLVNSVAPIIRIIDSTNSDK